jgi:hypothetical protein
VTREPCTVLERELADQLSRRERMMHVLAETAVYSANTLHQSLHGRQSWYNCSRSPCTTTRKRVVHCARVLGRHDLLALVGAGPHEIIAATIDIETSEEV